MRKMRQGLVKYNNEPAGILTEDDNGEYVYVYDEKYMLKYPHQFITFQMPVTSRPFRSKRLFPFFDGLIPEGWRQKRGGWVGDFGPVHTHSFLSKKKAAEIAGMYEFDDRFDRREESEVASRCGSQTAIDGADSKISDDDEVSESIGEFSTVDINREAGVSHETGRRAFIDNDF